LRFELPSPFVGLDREQCAHCLASDIELGEVEILRARDRADLRFSAAAVPFAAIKNPFQHAHVFAKTGPQKFSVRTFAEPVHAENERWICETVADFEPMLKILAHVVAAE